MAQFPCADGGEAGQWCPTGSGEGFHWAVGATISPPAAGSGSAVSYPPLKEPAPGAKKIKAATKEGGKKGVEIEGAADMGGLLFFATSMKNSDGDISLLIETMKGMNAVPDPNDDEERKGCSGHIGKLILSVSNDGTSSMALVAYVPSDKTDMIDAKEWLVHTMTQMGMPVTVIPDFFYGSPNSVLACADIPNSPAKDVFVLKIKDLGLQSAFGYLKLKGYFDDKDESEDDEYYGGDTEW